MNPNNLQQFDDGDFVKSSRCVSPPGGCVEVAIKGNVVAVRDAKNPTCAPLIFTKSEWDAFVQGVKAGEFDAGNS
jgi:hypothetical protein